MNGDRNAIARAAFRTGLGQRASGKLVGPDGRELNAGKPFRVAIVVVSQGAMVHADFALALGSLCFNPGALIALIGQKLEPGLGNLSMALNNAIEASRPIEVDYHLLLAPDVPPPQWALRQLLSHQVDVAGAAYMRASADQGLIVHPLNDDPIDPGQPLVEVRAIPPGCMLIRTAIFEKLRRPYFRAGVIEEDPEHGVQAAIVPEWIGFCDQVREAGMKVHMDVGLSLAIQRAGEALYKMPAPPTQAEQVAAAIPVEEADERAAATQH